jgi:hypothetical protein
VAQLSAYRLMNMLNSRQDLKFDDSFDISVKLFSEGAVRYRAATNQSAPHMVATAPTISLPQDDHTSRSIPAVGPSPPEDLFGAKDFSEQNQMRNVISLPIDKNNVLSKLCLAFALLIGWENLCKRDKESIFYNSNNRDYNLLLKVKYGRAIPGVHSLCRKFLLKYGIESEGPLSFSKICQIIVCSSEETMQNSQKLPVQVILIDSESLAFVEQYPFKTIAEGNSRPIIYLLKEGDHISYISSITRFFAKKKLKCCINCRTFTKWRPHSWRLWSHICIGIYRKNICTCCNRPFKTEHIFTDCRNTARFCHSKLVSEISLKSCVKCQIPLLSCAEDYHSRVCSIYGLYKICCQKFIYRVQQVPGKSTIQDLRDNHQCDFIGCKNCQKQYPIHEGYKHHCEILPLKKQNNNTWLGFAYFMEKNLAKTECFNCFALKTNCSIHKNDKHLLTTSTDAEVNLISLAYQSNATFQTTIFKEPEIHIENRTINKFENSVKFPIPNYSRAYNWVKNKQQCEEFLRRPSNSVDVVSKFLFALLTLSRNSQYTIYLNLFAITMLLQCLISNKLVPIILQHNNVYMSLTLLNLRFVNINLLFQNTFIIKYFSSDSVLSKADIFF